MWSCIGVIVLTSVASAQDKDKPQPPKIGHESYMPVVIDKPFA
jgi:hypothetical protein